MSVFNRLILQCRSGFEKEAAGEITDRAAEIGIYGYCQLEEGAGYLSYICGQSGDALELMKQIRFRSLIFIRQWMACGDKLELSPDDRIGQIEALIQEYPLCNEVRIEHPDTTEGRELGKFARKFGSALAQKLKKTGTIKSSQAAGMRLHLFLLSGTEMYLGVAPVKNAAPWLMGIPRLKFPRNAPSRSTLKLEEAWHWFIPPKQWDERIPMGGRAVDLGAAPGGWTWQLVNRSMFVTAVDNGPMNNDLMESGQVVHKEEDAYQFVPEKTVDMMVCDVVEKPVRTALMAAEWVLNGYCIEAIFNLKLPMKQRYKEVVSCMGVIDDQMSAAGVKYELHAKHLYHDREEITCSLRVL